MKKNNYDIKYQKINILGVIKLFHEMIFHIYLQILSQGPTHNVNVCFYSYYIDLCAKRYLLLHIKSLTRNSTEFKPILNLHSFI